MFYFLYYFPLGMDIQLRKPVWATWVIIGACLVGFMISNLTPDAFYAFYEHFVFIPIEPTLTSMVLSGYFHGGWMHLISNMIFLIVFAPALEDRLGAGRFLILYHVCLIAGNLVQGSMALHWIPETQSFGILGASGAISGLMGLYMIRLYFAKLRVGYWAFLPLQAYTKAGAVRVPVGVAVVLWLILQIGLSLAQKHGAIATVAVGAHLGGFLAGAGLALAMGMRSEAIAEQKLHLGKQYLERSLWFPAQGEFIEYVRRRPEDVEGHLELARTYRFTRNHSQADQHYRTACTLLQKAKRWDRILRVYREAERGNLCFRLSQTMQLQVAHIFERSLKPLDAERAFLKYEEDCTSNDQGALALYRAGRLALQENAELRALDTFEQLLSKYPNSLEADLAHDECVSLCDLAA